MKNFRNINRTVTTDTDNYFASNPNTGDLAERLAKRTWWVRSAARAYGVSAPAVHVSNRVKANGGFYRKAGDGCIVLGSAMSNIALFRNFRKHLQANGFGEKKKADSIGWAHSLYKTVRPSLYDRLVAEGRIKVSV